MVYDKSKWRHCGIAFPHETMKKLDERRGRYMTRNMYLLRIVEDYLDKERTNESNGVRGSESSNQVPTAPTPTYTEALKTNTFIMKGGFRG